VQAGVVDCVRCGFPIAVGVGWHLDHTDDRLHYLGPAHAGCNLRAAAKRGNTLKRERQRLARLVGSPKRVWSREW
jgi:hypothetical protein